MPLTLLLLPLRFFDFLKIFQILGHGLISGLLEEILRRYYGENLMLQILYLIKIWPAFLITAPFLIPANKTKIGISTIL